MQNSPTSNKTKLSANNVMKLSYTVAEDNVIEGATHILKVIRPSWSCDNIQFKLFTDGITNKLVGCFNQNNNTLNGANDPEDHGDYNNDVVLIRVYGNKTDLLIDRKKETENIQLLHRYNYAPTLFATFSNGLAYEFVPGKTLTPETCRLEKIWKLVAKRMAQIHKINPDDIEGDHSPNLWTKGQQFLDLVPDTFTDADKHERISKIFPTVTNLRQDFKDLYSALEKLNSPTVFCHNDLLLGNVIYTEDKNKVTFIDYEYAGFNHQAFDIGNHFAEFAGIDEVDIDYSRYPSKEFQVPWLREYLQEFTGHENIADESIERLYVEVNQFALASHFLWTIWALIQAEHSTIEFDFISFAEIRYNEYLRRKDEFLGLK